MTNNNGDNSNNNSNSALPGKWRALAFLNIIIGGIVLVVQVINGLNSMIKQSDYLIIM